MLAYQQWGSVAFSQGNNVWITQEWNSLIEFEKYFLNINSYILRGPMS